TVTVDAASASQAAPPPTAPAPQAALPPTAPARPITPAPAPAPQAAPPPPARPAPGAVNPLYSVRIGPVSDRDRASAIAKQLAAGGFSPTRSEERRVGKEGTSRRPPQHRHDNATS